MTAIKPLTSGLVSSGHEPGVLNGILSLSREESLLAVTTLRRLEWMVTEFMLKKAASG